MSKKVLLRNTAVIALLLAVLITFASFGSLKAYAATDSMTTPKVMEITNPTLNKYKDELFFEDSFTNDGYTLNYRYYKPANTSQKIPLVICLHGRGERGSDNDIQLNNAFVRPFIENENSKFYQAMVVAPQCPVKEFNNGWVNIFKDDKLEYDSFSVDAIEESVECKTIVAMIESLCTNNNIDRNRIYLIGLSQGAMATWDLLARHSELFAAAVPIAGVGDPTKAKIYADIPIYAFHGKEDAIVPYEKGTPVLYEAIKAEGKDKMHFVSFTDGNHGVWEAAIVFKGTDTVPALEDWLFSQTKGKEEKSGCGSSLNVSEIYLIAMSGIICVGAYIGLSRKSEKPE